MSDDSGNYSRICSEVMVEGGGGTKPYISSNTPLVTNIHKTHKTETLLLLDLGINYGKMEISSTVSHQNIEPGLVYSCIDIGEDVTKSSVGTNLLNCYGVEIGYCDDQSIFVNFQTSIFHYDVSFGIDGLSVVYEIETTDNNTITYDLEITYGFGLIAIIGVPLAIACGFGFEFNSVPTLAPAY